GDGMGVVNLTWPGGGTAALSLMVTLPGSGRLKVQGRVIVQPFDAQASITIRDAAVEPYQSYMKVNARFSGRFNGESKNRIAFKDGKMILTSKGTSWADKVEVRLPVADNPM